MGHNRATDNIIIFLILIISFELMVIAVLGSKMNDTNRKIEVLTEQVEQLERVYE